MSWNFTIKFLDLLDNVLATEMTSSDRADWKAPSKLEVMKFESKYPEIDWKKISVVIEKV